MIVRTNEELAAWCERTTSTIPADMEYLRMIAAALRKAPAPITAGKIAANSVTTGPMSSQPGTWAGEVVGEVKEAFGPHCLLVVVPGIPERDRVGVGHQVFVRPALNVTRSCSPPSSSPRRRRSDER